MSLSCTISELGLLSIIARNLKRSRYRWETIFVNLKANTSYDSQSTKFEVSSLSRRRDILGELKI